MLRLYFWNPVRSCALLLMLSALASTGLADEKLQRREIAAPPRKPAIGPENVWLSETPADCPFSRSVTLRGLRFTGRHAEYTNADTWYPSWASDNKLYSPFTDGVVNGLKADSAGPNANTGQATILGDDPMKLQVVDQSVYQSSPSPYLGRYPCGSLVYNGIWYYGTYCLGPAGLVRHEGVAYNWPWLGPFVGFRYSTDFGKTWTQTPRTPDKPLFGENGLEGKPVRIGSPHFVDFGRNMEHSPDGKAYLVAHGASVPDPKPRFCNHSWITGDAIYLLRVTPSIENINDASKYEFCAGLDADGKAIWTNDFQKIKPIAEWNDNMGCVTITYNAPLKKYIMCVTDGTNTVGYFHTYLLESDQIAGPWKLVNYMKQFGEQAYFVNIPSKFISADGRRLWLCYAANFAPNWNGTSILSRPPGSRYGMCLQEVDVLGPGDVLPVAPPKTALDAEDNVARSAMVSVSSTPRTMTGGGLIDGSVSDDPQQEWISREKETAMARLTWRDAQNIDRVWLFDRANASDQVTSAMLVFSDGSTISVGELPNDAKTGIEVKFSPRKVTWMAVIVTGVSPSTENVGLAEIAAFRAK